MLRKSINGPVRGVPVGSAPVLQAAWVVDLLDIAQGGWKLKSNMAPGWKRWPQAAWRGLGTCEACLLEQVEGWLVEETPTSVVARLGKVGEM